MLGASNSKFNVSDRGLEGRGIVLTLHARHPVGHCRAENSSSDTHPMVTCSGCFPDPACCAWPGLVCS